MLFLSTDELESLRGPVGGGVGGGNSRSTHYKVARGQGEGGGSGGAAAKDNSTLSTLMPVILPNKAIYATTSWGSKVNHFLGINSAHSRCSVVLSQSAFFLISSGVGQMFFLGTYKSYFSSTTMLVHQNSFIL